MKSTVTFYLGSQDGLTGLFLETGVSVLRRQYAGIRERCLRQMQITPWAREKLLADCAADADPDAMALLEQVAASGTAALQADTAVKARLLDRLMDDFCRHCREQELWELADETILDSRHYHQDRAEVQRKCGAPALAMWNHILHGRGIGRTDGVFPYESCDGIAFLGWWTQAETRRLTEELRAAFVDHDFEGASVRGILPAFPGRKSRPLPPMQGIWCAWRALQMANRRNTGLIFSTR